MPTTTNRTSTYWGPTSATSAGITTTHAATSAAIPARLLAAGEARVSRSTSAASAHPAAITAATSSDGELNPTRNAFGICPARVRSGASSDVPGFERCVSISGTRASVTATGSAVAAATARSPFPAGHEQPERLGRHDERREVVRGDRERGGHRPPHQRPAAPFVEIAHEEPERQRAEQDREGVGARLLRVPDEQRVDRDHERGDEPDRPRHQLPPGGVGHGHGEEAAQRRQRPRSDLSGAEQLRPRPREGVVERRRGLAVRDGGEHVARRLPQEPDRDELVVVEALRVERGEAKGGCQREHQQQRKAVSKPRPAAPAGLAWAGEGSDSLASLPALTSPTLAEGPDGSSRRHGAMLETIGGAVPARVCRRRRRLMELDRADILSRMNAADLQAHYYAETAGEYMTMHDEQEHHQARAWMEGWALQNRVQSVLDVGAGTGANVARIKEAMPRVRVVGIEPVAELRAVGYDSGLDDGRST